MKDYIEASLTIYFMTIPMRNGIFFIVVSRRVVWFMGKNLALFLCWETAKGSYISSKSTIYWINVQRQKSTKCSWIKWFLRQIIISFLKVISRYPFHSTAPKVWITQGNQLQPYILLNTCRRTTAIFLENMPRTGYVGICLVELIGYRELTSKNHHQKTSPILDLNEEELKTKRSSLTSKKRIMTNRHIKAVKSCIFYLFRNLMVGVNRGSYTNYVDHQGGRRVSQIKYRGMYCANHVDKWGGGVLLKIL